LTDSKSAARQDLDKVTFLPAPTRRTCLVAARALAATASSVAECAGSVLVPAHLQSVQRLVNTIEVALTILSLLLPKALLALLLACSCVTCAVQEARDLVPFRICS